MIGGRLEQLSISRRKESCSEAWCCSRTPGGRHHHHHLPHCHHRYHHSHHHRHHQNHHRHINSTIATINVKILPQNIPVALIIVIISSTNANSLLTRFTTKYLTKWSFGLWPCDHENPCLTWSLWTNGASSAKVVCPRRKWTCRRKSLKEAPKLMAYWLSIEQRQNGISASVWSFEGEFYRRKHSLGS